MSVYRPYTHRHVRPAPRRWVGTISSGILIGLNELTLVGSAPNIAIIPGATSVVLNEVTLAGSAPNLAVVSIVSVALNEITLASSIPNLTVVPGGATVSLNEVTLAGSAPSLAVVPGAVIVGLNELTLVGSAPTLTVTSVVSVPMNELTLAGTAPNLTVVPGGTAVVLNELTLAGSAPNITIPAPSAIVSLNEITLASSAVALLVIEPQILTPDADVAIGSWTDELGGTTDIFTSIDEPANAISDADYIQSEQLPATSAYEAGLSNVDDPQTSTSHYVSYRYQRDIASASVLDLTVRLKQGAATLATWSHPAIAVGWITAIQELSVAQADSITDYDDLRLEFEADVQ